MMGCCTAKLPLIFILIFKFSLNKKIVLPKTFCKNLLQSQHQYEHAEFEIYVFETVPVFRMSKKTVTKQSKKTK